jgi:hypothetical protein
VRLKVALVLSLTAVACDNSLFIAIPTGGSADCLECEIVAREEWSSTRDDPLVNDASVFFRAGGSLWVAGGFMGASVAEFPMDGGFASPRGRVGEGPSELQDVLAGTWSSHSGQLALAQADRVSLLDVQTGRIDWIDGRGVRSGSSIVWTDEALVIAQGLENDGVLEVREPIDGPARKVTYSQAREGVRFIAPARAPYQFWIVESRHDGFQLMRGTLTGNGVETKAFDPVTPTWWIPPRSVAPTTGPEVAPRRGAPPPPTRVLRLYDAGKVVFVLVTHADRNWTDWDRRYWEPGRGYDSVVMAIDSATGRSLAVERFEEFAYGFTNRGELVRYTVDRRGAPTWTLLSLRLVGWS